MSHLLCDSSGLRTPLKRTLPPNDAGQEHGLVKELRSLLENKQSPILIVDGNAVRNNWSVECAKLSKLTGLPTFTTCMGKGGTDETAANFGGVYEGAGSIPDVRDAVESSDCVFWIGNFPVSSKYACLCSGAEVM
jgi:pyruvate decarboxylase